MTESLVQRVRPTGTIRGRLLGGSLIVLLLLLTSGLVNFWAMARLDQATSALQSEADRATAALKAARASADMLATVGHAASRQDVAYLDEAVTEARAALYDVRTELIETVADLPEDDEVQLEASRAHARMVSMDFLAHLVLSYAHADDWANVGFYETQMQAAYEEIAVRSLESIVALTEERRSAAAASADAARQLASLFPLAFGALALGATAITVLAAIRSITGPVEQLAEGAALLAEGQLDQRVPAGRGDELGQLATAFNMMAERLQASHSELEERVAERTRALQEVNYALHRRALQLEASAEVGRAITSIFDVDQLLRRTVELIRERFGFYHAGIFLVDEAGEWVVLREATGEAGAQMKALGHRLLLGETSMVGWTALHRRPRISLDVGKDAVHYAHPLLPRTRSEMTLPLTVGGQLLGVLDVQSTAEGAFEQDDVRALQGMADQIAVAIENARRMSGEAALLEATSPIYRIGRELTTATTTREVADAIIASVAETGADGCAVSLFDYSPDGQPESLLYAGVWRRDREPRFSPGMRVSAAESLLPPEIASDLLVIPDVAQDVHLPESARRQFEATGVAAVANIPLRAEERVIGQVVVLRGVPGPFPEAAIRLYEALSDQAAVALERARLQEATRRRADEEAALRAAGDRLARAVDFESVLQGAAEELSQALGASGVYVEFGPRPVTAEDEVDGASGGVT